MGSIRVAIVGVGNCAASLVQGVEYYKDADPAARVPGLMHVKFGPYHVRDVEFVAAFDVDAKKVGSGPLRRDRRQREQHDQDRRRAAARRHRPARPHPRRPRQVLPRDHRPSPTTRRSTSSRRCARPASTCWSATCRSVPSRPRSSTPSARSTRGSPSSTPCRSSSRATRSGPRSSRRPACRSSATTSSRQVGATITHRVLAKLFEDRGVIARPHVPAQRRRQHGLHEHARARAPGVQEDLQDAVGHLAARARSRPATCTSARPTTWRGSTTASGRTSASRAAPSATCR